MQMCNELPFLFLHPFGLGLTAAFMVIPGKMEDPVQKEKMEPRGKGYAPLFRLACTGNSRNHHISQDLGVHPGKWAFLHGKGYDIGGLVATKEFSVEAANATVSHDDD